MRPTKTFCGRSKHAPVTVDQWQLEKLALVSQNIEVTYAIPGVPADYRSKTWGRSYADPQEAVAALCAGLKPGARIAIVPEGPYVLAQANAQTLAEHPATQVPAQVV